MMEDNRLIIAETKLLEIENHLIRLLGKVAPQVEPGDTVMDLYWQVDNYIAGVRGKLESAEEILKEASNLPDSGAGRIYSPAMLVRCHARKWLDK